MVKSEIQNVKLRFGIIGNTDGLNRAIDIAMQVAPTDLSVLVTGESGVGKESFPQIIHQFSRRKHGPYIAVNCGAIPEGTIDSELFGHEKGAFTGAISDRNGYFAEANGGTIFLDEVGELPLSTQARLLRVLESGEYIKVGSSKGIRRIHQGRFFEGPEDRCSHRSGYQCRFYGSHCERTLPRRPVLPVEHCSHQGTAFARTSQ